MTNLSKLLTLGFLLSLAFWGYSGFSLKEEQWTELKGDHFLVYFRGDENFAEGVLKKAEQYYRQISNDLGYARYDKFWQWEDRVKVFIYPTREEFWKTTGEKFWSQGVADYTHKEIRSHAQAENFNDALLPHEITHLIFRDYVGFKGEIPLWLDEGIAQWEEPEKRVVVKDYTRQLLEKGGGFSLTDLTELNIRRADSSALVTNFYLQSASLIDFLINEFGSERFINFCRQLRDGKNLEGALRFAYPTQIRTLKEMEEKWKKYIFR